MNTNFFSQGYGDTNNNLLNLMISKLNDDSYFHFYAMSAFSGLSLLNRLENHIISAKEHITEWHIIVGIDHKGTTKEALDKYLKLDIDTKIYYTTSAEIYHPKMYIFENAKELLLIIGSSNLTLSGFINNVETNLVIEFSKENEKELDIINSLKTFFEKIEQSPNTRLLSHELIKLLYDAGIILTEKERRKDNSTKRTKEKLHDNEYHDKLYKLFPPISPIKYTQLVEIEDAIPLVQLPSDIREKQRLLWEKKSLPKSDVMQTDTDNTHVTGQLRFTQADFKVDDTKIDQTIYFRYSIFGKEYWAVTKNIPLTESTCVLFRIRILNKDIGEHLLEIQHKPSGEAGQGNFTTYLLWGKISYEIRKQNLIGKRLCLYEPIDENEAYIIDIN